MRSVIGSRGKPTTSPRSGMWWRAGDAASPSPWFAGVGTRGFHRPLSDPRADLRVRLHGSERDGRNVPKAVIAIVQDIKRTHLPWECQRQDGTPGGGTKADWQNALSPTVLDHKARVLFLSVLQPDSGSRSRCAPLLVAPLWRRSAPMPVRPRLPR